MQGKGNNHCDKGGFQVPPKFMIVTHNHLHNPQATKKGARNIKKVMKSKGHVERPKKFERKENN